MACMAFAIYQCNSYLLHEMTGFSIHSYHDFVNGPEFHAKILATFFKFSLLSGKKLGLGNLVDQIY